MSPRWFVVLLATLCVCSAFATGEWESCNIIGFNSTWPYPVDCLTHQVPLNREANTPTDPYFNVTIPAFVQRLHANPAIPKQGSLWFFYGGPGSATTMGVVSQYLAIHSLLGGAFDLYFPDYRGVGRSFSLGSENCVRFSSGQFWIESDKCAIEANATWGNKLYYFTPTNIALDLIDLITMIHGTDGQEAPVFVLGVSFGTYMVNRFLTLAPVNLPITAAIQDGVCAPGSCMALNFGTNEDVTGRYFLNRYCASDPTCRSKLNNDPEGTLGQIYEDRARHGLSSCLGRVDLTHRQLAQKLKHLLEPTTSHFIPAIIHRLDRCSSSDRIQLQHWIDGSSSSRPTVDERVLAAPSGDSMVHLFNIEYSELWYGLAGETLPPPTKAQVESEYDNLFFASTKEGALNLESFLPGYHLWNRYPVDPYFGKFADSGVGLSTTIPILQLNGDLDTAAPFFNALLVNRAYASKSAHLHRAVIIPHGQHTTIGLTPVTNSAIPCGAQIIQDFILQLAAKSNNNDAFRNTSFPELNLSCLDSLVNPDFQGASEATRAQSETLFGTSNLWNDPIPSTGNSNDDNGTSSVSTVLAIVLALCGLLLGLSLGAFVMKYWLKRRERDGALDHFISLNDEM